MDGYRSEHDRLKNRADRPNQSRSVKKREGSVSKFQIKNFRKVFLSIKPIQLTITY